MQSVFAARGGVALALVLASWSCGGGGDSASPTSPSPTATPAPTGSSISIVGQRAAQSFSPNPAGAVAAGQTVLWRNNDAVVHRIVMNDGTLDTGNIAPGANSAAVTVPAIGGNYHCSIHPDMVGAISGSSGGPPPCTGDYC